MLTGDARQRVAATAVDLYGEQEGRAFLFRLEAMLAEFGNRHAALAKGRRDLPHDAVLITYGDQITAPGAPPLRSLTDWLSDRLSGAVDTVHILPFYPYSSDDGFSVVDYRQVDPTLGDWDDVAHCADRFALMFDAVINHVSARGAWFQAFLRSEAPYGGYFVTVDPDTDLSMVTRPRTTPLLHGFDTAAGRQHVWTTFSDDQIDLNYGNAGVLLEVIDVLLFYVAHGARLLRLDAVSYLWKEIGTSCINLPQTHAVIRLMRDVLDAAAPAVVIVTETNVPHAENIAYFGDGRGEAQMVYNFALPPLLLDAVYSGNAERLTGWARALTTPAPDRCCFFNITATHDGIGVRGASAWMSQPEIDRLADETQARGGLVSYRATPDGGRTPYELNITFFDALLPPGEDAAAPRSLDRYLTAQAVALSLAGVPGLYVHNLFGTRSWQDGLDGKDASQTEFKRLLNRRKFTAAELDAMMADPSARERRIFDRYMALLRLWRSEPAFRPTAPQTVLDLHPSVFAVERDGSGPAPVLCLHNLSAEPCVVTLPGPRARTDLISGTTLEPGRVDLPPYALMWLRR